MTKRIALLLACLFLTFLSACTKDKGVIERFEKIEARLEAIEKLINPPREEPQVQKEAYVIPLGASHVLGDPAAKINIVVFSNFECPYCAKADKKLRELLSDASMKDKVNIAFKHFPFDRHTNARPASKAALAVGEQGNDKFWAMTDKIFSNQDSLSPASYEKWAKEVGADLSKFKADLLANDKKYDDIINADIKLGSEAAQLRGTPWILVGGWLLEGEPNAATINKMIEEKKL